MRRFWRKAYKVMVISIGHINRDDGWAMASHLALSGLMAIFPFLIFVAALAGFVGEAQLADQVTDLLFEVWPPEIAEPFSNEVHRVLTVPRGGVLTVSILVTIFLASNGVEAVRMGLNRAYRSDDRRSIIRLRAQSFVFVIIGAVASLALAILGVLGPILWNYLQGLLPALAPFSRSFTLIRYGVVGGLLTTGLIAAHLWLPGRRPPMRHIWPGIAMTLFLWWVATVAFATYLENFAHYSATYAGLASVVAAIFYLYLMGWILIFGGEFNAAIAFVRDDEPPGVRETTPGVAPPGAGGETGQQAAPRQ